MVQRTAFPELNFRVQEVQPLHIAMKDFNAKYCRISKFDFKTLILRCVNFSTWLKGTAFVNSDKVDWKAATHTLKSSNNKKKTKYDCIAHLFES